VPAPGDGDVTLPLRFTVYEVTDGQVAGYRKATIAERVTVRAEAPVTVRMPTFGDPDGTIDLVRLVTGKLKGEYVHPGDPGIDYTPD
jgi:hypothetical protein